MAETISKVKSCLPASPVKFYDNRISQKTLGLQEETEMVRNIPAGTQDRTLGSHEVEIEGG